jgi:hypothetical protein
MLVMSFSMRWCSGISSPAIAAMHSSMRIGEWCVMLTQEGMHQQVDELEEEQQRDEREVLDGLGAHHGSPAEDEQEDAERDDDERDDAELDVTGAGGELPPRAAWHPRGPSVPA